MNNNTVVNFPHGMKVAVAKDWYYILVKVQWLTPLMGTDLHCMVLDLNT